MDMLLQEGIDRPIGVRMLSADTVQTMLTRQTTDDQPIGVMPAFAAGAGCLMCAGIDAAGCQQYQSPCHPRIHRLRLVHHHGRAC